MWLQSIKEGGVSLTMSSRSSGSEPAYLGMIAVAAFHYRHHRRRVRSITCFGGQDLVEGGEIVVSGGGSSGSSRIKDFSVLLMVGRVSGRE
jgi:hypothetical protein